MTYENWILLFAVITTYILFFGGKLYEYIKNYRHRKKEKEFLKKIVIEAVENEGEFNISRLKIYRKELLSIGVYINKNRIINYKGTEGYILLDSEKGLKFQIKKDKFIQEIKSL